MIRPVCLVELYTSTTAYAGLAKPQLAAMLTIDILISYSNVHKAAAVRANEKRRFRLRP